MDNDQQLRFIYAGGLAHGALMRIRTQLSGRDSEGALRHANETIELIERVIFAVERGDRKRAE